MMDNFPYKLRKGQKELLSFLDNNVDKYNICIQAPTGFGKTVIVLSSLLKKRKKILWVVRTGTETDRPIEELKIINEKVGKDFSGLSFRGKRDMCLFINEKIKDRNLNYEDVSFFCDKNRKSCPYYKNLENFSIILKEPVLYSEILEFSKKYSICPYYYERKITPYMDVLSINYNYIINENLLWSLKRFLDINDSYLVVDEAHNLQFASMNINSDYIGTNSIERAINELETIDSETRSEALKFLNDLRFSISKVLNRKKEIQIEFFDFLDELKNIDDGIEILRELGLKVKNNMMKNDKRPTSSLYHISEFLNNSMDLMYEDGIVFILRREKRGFTLERWDMRSSKILEPIWNKFRSNIFISGTLEPIDAFIDVIGLKNYKYMSVDHKINKDRVKTYILDGLSTKGEKISKEMEKRYEIALGNFLKKFSEKNVAIFSASYRIQDALIKLVPDKFKERILIEKEGMSGNESRKILDAFKKMAYSDKKGILFASASGRFSEGADFPGEELEAVFLAGIPFERLTLKTKMYIKYFENLYGEKGRFYAYIVPALRKASQAMGRVIRSENDNGYFILADERYYKEDYFNLLPSFIKNTYKLINYDDKID